VEYFWDTTPQRAVYVPRRAADALDEGKRMRKALWVAVSLVVLGGTMGQAVGLGPIALGFHLTPIVERQDGRRAWDLSMSLGITVALDSADSVEFTAIMDSGPTALGTTVTYRGELTGHVSLGGGITALWPIADGAHLRTPLFESFAHVSVYDGVGEGLSAEASAALPFLTVAKRTDRWAIFPLADLPSIGLAADVHIDEGGSLKMQLTLQPVIADTTALVDPFGRVTDDLLVLPMVSAFMRYVP
jgi:hypothetical protein